MQLILARCAFVIALIVVTFFALTPGPLGQIIESGEGRHILAFAALPVLSAIGWPQLPLRVQFMGYSLFGAAIEFVQAWMAVGRRGEPGDWLVDMLAAGTALFLVRTMRRSATPRPA